MAARTPATSASSARIRGEAASSCWLAPGYEGEVPEGHFACRSGTNNVFVFLRAFYADASDLKLPVDLIEKT
jgi:hypothetical protein